MDRVRPVLVVLWGEANPEAPLHGVQEVGGGSPTAVGGGGGYLGGGARKATERTRPQEQKKGWIQYPHRVDNAE